MVSNAIDGLGGLDILINNAGTAATTEPIPFEFGHDNRGTLAANYTY